MTFPIVAIAASAGGLEALSELLSELPAKTGMAFAVVQHLDPTHESLLTEILSKRAAIRVRQAEDGALLERDHVYAIPPNTALTLREDDRLQLGPRAQGRDRHMPGDILFRSFAESRAETAIGVVLSGGDSDGASGIQAIKHAGGITFAQEPGSAKFPGMPKHAIDTGCVDFVLPPKAIAQELTRLNKSFLRSIPIDSPIPLRRIARLDGRGWRQPVRWLRMLGPRPAPPPADQWPGRYRHNFESPVKN